MSDIKVHIKLQRNTNTVAIMRDWEIKVKPDSLLAVNNLKSGEVFHLERNVNDLQKEKILIRPYYRRMIRGELHVFAMQVKPKIPGEKS